MKIFLYTENLKVINKSGLGKAIEHQMLALESQGIPYTTDPEDDYDVAHFNFYLFRSVYLASQLRRKGIPIVYHAHSTEEDFKNSFLFSNKVSPEFRKWLTFCYRFGDAIVTPTPYSKKLLENYNLNAPIYAISNGIDLHQFQRTKEAGLRFRQKYNYSEKDKVIVGIGLYLERKGILDFVELAKMMPEYQFIWFGFTPLYLVPNKIREAIHTNLVNLKFPGYVPQESIRDAMCGCDMYIFPTHEETEGIPVMEACALKTPTIIRDIPVFDEWLDDGVNIYKAKTNYQFMQNIKAYFNGQLPDITEKGYEVAKSRSIEEVGKQLKEVYASLLK